MKWALSLLLLAGILLLPQHTFAHPHSVLGTRFSVLVEEQTATPDFPDSVEFRLKARGFETARAELNYRLVGDSVTAGMQADRT
jgi:hypothetical protein